MSLIFDVPIAEMKLRLRTLACGGVLDGGNGGGR